MSPIFSSRSQAKPKTLQNACMSYSLGATVMYFDEGKGNIYIYIGRFQISWNDRIPLLMSSADSRKDLIVEREQSRFPVPCRFLHLHFFKHHPPEH